MEMIEDVFQKERKECKDQERSKMCRKKIHARATKVLQHEISNFVWASSSGRGEVCDRREKFSGEKGEAEKQMTPIRARGSAELGR